MRIDADGSTNVAVPTWMASAPATKKSRASSVSVMPPTPITGMRTARRTAATAARQDRAPRAAVDLHAEKCVDRRDRVRPGGLDGGRDGADVGDVGTELHHNAAFCDGSDSGRDPRRRVRITSQVEAVGDVGAGDVQLVAIDAGGVVEHAHAMHVVVGIGAGDVDDHGAAHAIEMRRVFTSNVLDTGVLQADAVEHPTGGLGHAWRRVAGAGIASCALGVQGADGAEVDELLELEAEAGGATGEANGVGEAQPPPEVDAQVDCHATVSY